MYPWSVLFLYVFIAYSIYVNVYSSVHCVPLLFCLQTLWNNISLHFDWNDNKLDSTVIQSVKEFLSLCVCDRRCTLKGWCLWDLSIRWSVWEICDLSSTIRVELSCFEQKALVRICQCFLLNTLQNISNTSLFLHSGCEWLLHILYCVCIFTEERNDWVCCLEKILSDRKNSLEPRNLFFKNGSVNSIFEGYLEMLSPRNKVYTLISRDKLFLFRSHEVWIWMWIIVFLNVLLGLFDRLVVCVLYIGIFSGCRHHWHRHANGQCERWRKQALFHAHHSIQNVQVNTAIFHFLRTKMGSICTTVLF